jgi:hypothetical protein
VEALQRIVKDRDYHFNQIESNLQKIKEKYEAIEALEKATERERQLVEEYNTIIDLIKMDMDFAQSTPKENQPITSITGGMENDNLPHSR